MRAYLAILIAAAAGAALAGILVALLRVVRPGSVVVRRDRLPEWFQRLTAWSRSRSLRLWCPDPSTRDRIGAHLQTEPGRRLSRLGVSIAADPWQADVLVVETADRARLDDERIRVPNPVATVVLADAADADELRDALVALASALRWPRDEVRE